MGGAAFPDDNELDEGTDDGLNDDDELELLDELDDFEKELDDFDDELDDGDDELDDGEVELDDGEDELELDDDEEVGMVSPCEWFDIVSITVRRLSVAVKPATQLFLSLVYHSCVV